MDSQVATTFVDSWENQKLHWDDIDFPNGDIFHQHDNLLQQFLSQNEEVDADLTVMNSTNPMLNASYANRMKQKSRRLNWKDVDINSFNLDYNKSKNTYHDDDIHDLTILKKPKLGKYDIFPDVGVTGAELDTLTTNNNSNSMGLNDDSLNEFGTLSGSNNYSNSLHALNTNSDDELDPDFNSNDDDNIHLSNRKVSNPDVSRNFSFQFTTPTVNNRTIIHNLQNSSHRTLSQQRRQVSDNTARNISYNTPGHRNIR